MASLIVAHNLISITHYSPRCYTKGKTLPLRITKFKQESLFSPIKFKQIKPLKSLAFPRIYAAQSNFAKVLQTAWKIGKDGIEAGTNLVPDSVPRPLARISVSVVTGALVLFVLKSVLSTAFFVVAMMGLIYFTYIALNKDEGPKGSGDGGTASTEDSLEEARRIMDKYK